MGNERIMFTGGAGFIGSHVAEYYANKGCEVVVLDNLSRHKLLGKTEAENVIHHNWNYLKGLGVKVVKGDIRNAEDLTQTCKNVDLVHAARQTAVTSSLLCPKVDFSVSAEVTSRLLDVVRKVSDGASLVFCSTNKVYGERVNSLPVIEEEQRYRFGDEYANGIG